jgi:hypothetical protein
MQTGEIMFMKRMKRALAFFSLALAAGCSSMGGAGGLFPAAGDSPIKIESNPTGAEVYVMGEKIGVTPVQIGHKDVFPNIYPHEKESLYGRVILKKEGCADYTRTISAEISNSGLQAKLNCKDTNPVSPKPSGATPAVSETVEQRLSKVKDLQNKGLITEEEAKQARERILNEL